MKKGLVTSLDLSAPAANQSVTSHRVVQAIPITEGGRSSLMIQMHP